MGWGSPELVLTDGGAASLVAAWQLGLFDLSMLGPGWDARRSVVTWVASGTPSVNSIKGTGQIRGQAARNKAELRSTPTYACWANPADVRFARQEVQVFSMVCNAVFSEDCNRRPQLYLVRIHILAYVQR